MFLGATKVMVDSFTRAVSHIASVLRSARNVARCPVVAVILFSPPSLPKVIVVWLNFRVGLGVGVDVGFGVGVGVGAAFCETEIATVCLLPLSLIVIVPERLAPVFLEAVSVTFEPFTLAVIHETPVTLSVPVRPAVMVTSRDSPPEPNVILVVFAVILGVGVGVFVGVGVGVFVGVGVGAAFCETEIFTF